MDRMIQLASEAVLYTMQLIAAVLIVALLFFGAVSESTGASKTRQHSTPGQPPPPEDPQAHYALIISGAVGSLVSDRQMGWARPMRL